MLKISLMLAVFAIVATSLVSLTEINTRDQILENERQALLSALNALVDTKRYDNDILADSITLPETAELHTKNITQVYRARKGNTPVAAVFTSIAPNGYNGEIKLLVGIYYDSTLAGVRVIHHKETPGLGDKIDLKKADWILAFNGLSLLNPVDSKWKVKKDGGDFDQFTGATITPRAVVLAVKNALQYFNQHRDELFAQTASNTNIDTASSDCASTSENEHCFSPKQLNMEQLNNE
ncbi:MAG: electron transport complex subunit RsxG [Methylophaga sp.]|nr:MAG: electron transport complex subunit RsxG [Methylophaga sp.]